MKKHFNFILLIITIVIFALIFSGCDELKGASAYDLAVQGGYEGTQEEWLNSLSTTTSPYDVAIKNGFVGTETEWLDSLVRTISNYDLAVKNGYTGTEAQWLDSLKGSDGATGLKGDSGENGNNGVDGVNIITPSEDINNITYAFSKAVLSTVKIAVSHTVSAPKWGQPDATAQESFTGAGVFYTLDKNSGDAYIITNFHVVYYKKSLDQDKIANAIKVFLYGMDYPQYAIDAEFIGGSMTYDIAVIKISGSDILKNSSAKVVSLSSDKVMPGLKTIAIGNPMSDGLAVTSGIVNIESEFYTNTGADDTSEFTFRAIRIDTPVNGGNSGGGLYNLLGELIGIVNAKKQAVEIDNVAYAIPLEIAVGVAQNIIDNCDENNKKIKKCVLGLQIQMLTSDAPYDEVTGITTITQVVSIANPVEESSLVYGILQQDDIFVEATLGAKTITINNIYILADLLLNARIGDTLEFIITREGNNITKSVVINENCLTSVI